jgi:hypothetical protein
LFPFTIVGVLTVGTAGGIWLPFAGDFESSWPCWAGAGPPTAKGGIIVSDALEGDRGFLVALA